MNQLLLNDLLRKLMLTKNINGVINNDSYNNKQCNNNYNIIENLW